MKRPKVTVGIDFANRTANVPLANTFAEAKIVEAGVTNDAATVTAAEALTTAFIANGGQPQTLAATAGVDTLSATAAGSVFNAPLVLSQTLNAQTESIGPGDSFTDTFKDGTINVTLNDAGALINGAIVPNVTMTGISTANVTNVTGVLAPITNGFAGNITGLTTVNDKNSNGGVQLGVANDGLNTLLTNVNISGFAGAPGQPMFGALVAAAAGDATKTIAINVAGSYGNNKGVGLGSTGANTIGIGSDGPLGTAAAPQLSYGTWSLTTNGTDFLQLTPNAINALGVANVDATTNLTLLGTGKVTLGTDVAGNFGKLTTIDATGMTGGSVTITGASAGAGTNAFGAVSSLGGSIAGLLTGDTVLTSFKGDPSGANFLDISSENAAQFSKLVATGNTTSVNTIVVSDAVATTASAATFAGITNFQDLGVAAIGGTINMANLPAAINDILYVTAAGGAVNINNVTQTLTVDTQNNGNAQALTIGAVGPNAGFNDAVNVLLGATLNQDAGALPAAPDVLGNVSITGEEAVNFASQGKIPQGAAAANFNQVGTVILNPTAGGGEHVTITGDSSIVFGFNVNTGGIFDFNAATTFDNINDLTIMDTTAGSTILELDGAANINNGFSTNAFLLNASGSGTAGGQGLLMRGGDANFVINTTPTSATGDTIIGSAVASNILIGSKGNDILTGGTGTDSIGTDGGADTITLGVGHNGSDHIALYSGTSAGGSVGGVVIDAIAGSITSNNNVAQSGYFASNFGANGTPFGNVGSLGVAGGGMGTAVDVSTVTNFNTKADILDFSVKAWGSGGTDGGQTTHGLSTDTGAHEGINANLVSVNVSLGGLDHNTTPHDLIILGGTTFLNAQDVASSLSGAGTAITFSNAIAAGEYHLLVAYQNTLGNTTIADVDLFGRTNITSTASDANHFLAASDMVQLAGVNLAQFTAAQVHYVA